MDRIRYAVALLAALSVSCASVGRFDRYAEAYAGYDEFLDARGIPAFPASSPRLYLDGDAWFERATELIAGARESILVMSFLTTVAERQDEVFAALAEARARGVRVYLLVDSASYYRSYPGGGTPIRAAIPKAVAAGIPLVEYNPLRGRRVPIVFPLFDRDHRKFWVVDGRYAALGGQNIDYDSLRPPEEGGCIDAMLEYDSPEASSFLIDSFVRTWNAYSLDRLDARDFARAEAAPRGDAAGPADEGSADDARARVRIFDQGLRYRGQVSDMFDAFFSFAREELWLVQCYTYLTPGLIARIKSVAGRGVRVKFMLSANHIGSRFELGSYFGMLDLLDAGVELYLHESPSGSLLHYKMIMADGAWASVGSANYNGRSQTLSRELSYLADDEESLGLIKANLEELLRYARPVGREEAKRYRGLPYRLNNILMQFWG